MPETAALRIDPVPKFETLERLCEWLIQTCLMWGAALETALIVAWHFAHDPKVQQHFGEPHA